MRVTALRGSEDGENYESWRIWWDLLLLIGWVAFKIDTERWRWRGRPDLKPNSHDLVLIHQKLEEVGLESFILTGDTEWQFACIWQCINVHCHYLCLKVDTVTSWLSGLNLTPQNLIVVTGRDKELETCKVILPAERYQQNQHIITNTS